MSITVRDVTVTGQHKRPILHDIRLTIPAGSITLIVGRNGAGKSTLLDAISGLTRLSAGTVQYGDRLLWQGNKLDAETIGQIGHVFQSPEQQLFATTVEREIAYSLAYLRLSREEVQRRALEAMRNMALPEQLLQEMPQALSGGQKRRTAIASTIAAEPKWLMLDEPTAGLDASGIAALLDFLTERREAGCGIVIATHDLDALFKLADRVIVLQDGRVAAEAAQHDLSLAGSILRDAGLALPTALELADRLREAGLELEGRLYDPQELAEAIAHGCAVSVGRPMHGTRKLVGGLKRIEHPRSRRPSTEQQGEQAADSVRTVDRSRLERLDPRAKWLFYMAASIGILIQTSWTGLAFGGTVAAAILLYARVPWRPILLVVAPFALFVVVSILISGLQLQGGIGFDLGRSLKTLYALLKIVVVALLGIGFAAVTSQLMIRRAVEQSLHGLKRIGFPVEALALGGSLMLSFIPVMGRELRRFARIVKSRGKDVSGKDGIRPRHLPPLFIPLIISLFQFASDLTTAMQARGLSGFGQRRTASVRLRMQREDWGVAAAGAMFLAVLVCMRYVVDIP